jgi:outer membrane protein assembly factor BamB
MTTSQTDESTLNKPLRLWPGVVAVAVLWLARFGLPMVAPDLAMYSIIVGAPLGILAFIIWWAFFSRAPHVERWGAFALMIVALLATSPILHKSIATGMMGMMFYIYALPLLALAFVVWALVSRRLAVWPRRIAMVASILLACGVWTLVRTDGITGSGASQFAWRWSATAEEQLEARGIEEPATPISTTASAETGASWPGFRGPNRDGIVQGVRIKTDWSASPPVEMWRQPIGPAWSSFAVRGDLLYTQEQRGNDEVVACYNLTTGKLVWRHRDAARFWESNAGAGPRATPTLSNGRAYTLGATGILSVLDANNGAVVWSRNAAADTNVKVPGWGFSSSPLVVGDVVIVATAGTLAAYDIAKGNLRWVGPDDRSGYSSPHLITVNGVQQVLLLNGAGAISVAPADGKVLWQHPLPSGTRILQPAMTADGDVLLHDGDGSDMRRIKVAQSPEGWTVEERWVAEGLHLYFNDFVVHKGYAFGFDGNNLACIDLKDGNHKWKGERYGNGQLVLLADQDLLLVLSEEGQMVLVGATPDQFTELARFPAIEGKTWNHPVLVGDVLLVRNSQEMAAFRLPLADR